MQSSEVAVEHPISRAFKFWIHSFSTYTKSISEGNMLAFRKIFTYLRNGRSLLETAIFRHHMKSIGHILFSSSQNVPTL